MMINVTRLLGAVAAIGVLGSNQALAEARIPWAVAYEPIAEASPEPLGFDPAGGAVDLLPSLSTAGVVSLQDSDPAEDALPAAPSPWRFSLDATFWLPIRMKGTLNIGDTSTNLDYDLQDVLDNLKMLVMGGFTFTNERFSFIGWGLYMNVGNSTKTETPLGQFDTSLDLQTTMFDFVVAGRIAEWPLGNSETATWSLDVLGGLRYWNIYVEIDEQVPSGLFDSIEQSTHWFDPIIGVLLDFDLSEQWRIAFRGDIGGFGIGSASEFTWRIDLLGYYALSPNVDLVLGWRQIEFNRDPGGGVDYDMNMYGPMVGATFRF